MDEPAGSYAPFDRGNTNDVWVKQADGLHNVEGKVAPPTDISHPSNESTYLCILLRLCRRASWIRVFVIKFSYNCNDMTDKKKLDKSEMFVQNRHENLEEKT